MKKTHWMITACLSVSVLLAGCGSSLPDLTAKQEEQIVEYAAAIVIRHLKNYDSRLVDLSDYEQTMPQEIPDADMSEEEPAPDTTKPDTPVVDVTTTPTQTVEEVLLPAGVSVSPAGYLVTDSYPGDSSENAFFALDATEEKKLLVLQFDLRNEGTEPAEIDIFSVSPKCYVQINEDDKRSMLSTMLLDDLSTYIGTLQAGEGVTLVLLAEVDAAAVTDISALEFFVSTSNGTAGMSF